MIGGVQLFAAIFYSPRPYGLPPRIYEGGKFWTTMEPER